MFEYLPKIPLKEIEKLKPNNVTELRIRANSSSYIYYDGQTYKFNYVFTYYDVNDIVFNACKRSIYSFEEQIKQGYVTTEHGERIGLAGEFVYENNKILTIKNFTSLCIRIPKEIKGFSLKFFNEYYNEKSILVISKTGVGKTTFLRDLTYNISNKYVKNIVVIDERNEIACKSQNNSFYLGESVDVLTYSSKDYGFKVALRTLNPEVVVTDELISENDFLGVLNAHLSGLKIIASIHSDSIDELIDKKSMQNLIKQKVFEYYIFLNKVEKGREVEIYSKDFKKICSYVN